jgi:hypothetical protein
MISVWTHTLRAPTFDSESNSPVRSLQSYFLLLVVVYLLTMVCDGPLRYLRCNPNWRCHALYEKIRLREEDRLGDFTQAKWLQNLVGTEIAMDAA